MFITNESMQVLKAGKATVSGSYKVGQVVTFKCGDGSTQKAKCTHAFYANANMPVGEFEPLEPQILVQFRKFPDGEIIALFPYEITGSSDIQSYMHIGQHGAADFNIKLHTKQAKPDEYCDLLKELKTVGYSNLKVVNRSYYRKYVEALNSKPRPCA